MGGDQSSAKGNLAQKGRQVIAEADHAALVLLPLSGGGRARLRLGRPRERRHVVLRTPWLAAWLTVLGAVRLACCGVLWAARMPFGTLRRRVFGRARCRAR